MANEPMFDDDRPVLFLSPTLLSFRTFRRRAMADSFSKSEWKERIAPHLSTSLREASDRITQSAPVQSWLQRASMEAAEGLGQMGGLQGEMQGYMHMMNDLDAALPALTAAVDELTDGCGRLDLNWRPLNPNFSRLYIDFDRDYTVALFCHLETCTTEAARDALRTVAAALPEGEPFPNRPNTVTGLVGRNGTGVGVQIKEALADGGGQRRRAVTLRPGSGDALEDLSAAAAARRLCRLLCPDAADRSSS